MKARAIDVGGNRTVLVGTYELDNGQKGQEPEVRVFISSGWANTVLPFRSETVDIPLSVLSALLAALEDLT